jgi:hypothetical protein
MPDVIPAGHDLAAPCEYAVYGERNSRAEGVHSPPECNVILRFNDQVQVISLDRVVNEAEARPRATRPETLAQCLDEAIRAERGQPFPDSHRDKGRR